MKSLLPVCQRAAARFAFALCMGAAPLYGATASQWSTLILATQTAATLGYTAYDQDTKGAEQYAMGAALSGGGLLLFGATVTKSRPDGGGHDAFPSGHATLAFLNAGYAARRYGLNALTMLSYVSAAATGYLRMAAERHDFYDVLGGALLGTAGALLFTTPHETAMALEVRGGTVVLRLSLRW